MASEIPETPVMAVVEEGETARDIIERTNADAEATRLINDVESLDELQTGDDFVLAGADPNKIPDGNQDEVKKKLNEPDSNVRNIFEGMDDSNLPAKSTESNTQTVQPEPDEEKTLEKALVEASNKIQEQQNSSQKPRAARVTDFQDKKEEKEKKEEETEPSGELRPEQQDTLEPAEVEEEDKETEKGDEQDEPKDFSDAGFKPGDDATEDEEPDIDTESVELGEGETLWDLSQKFGIPVNEIEAVNDIDNPEEIPVGTKIKLPQSQADKVKEKREQGEGEQNVTKEDISDPPEKSDPSSLKDTVINLSKTGDLGAEPDELEISGMKMPSVNMRKEEITATESPEEVQEKGEENFGDFADAISAFLSPSTFQAMRKLELEEERLRLREEKLDQASRGLDLEERDQQIELIKENARQSEDQFERNQEIINEYQSTLKDKEGKVSSREKRQIANDVIKSLTGAQKLSKSQKQLRNRLVRIGPEKLQQRSALDEMNTILNDALDLATATEASSPSEKKPIFNMAKRRMARVGKQLGLSDDQIADQLQVLRQSLEASKRKGFKRVETQLNEYFDAPSDSEKVTLGRANRLLSEVQSLNKSERSQILENQNNVDSIQELKDKLMGKLNAPGIDQQSSDKLSREDAEQLVKGVETDMIGDMFKMARDNGIDLKTDPSEISNQQLVGSYFERTTATTYLNQTDADPKLAQQAMREAEQARLRANIEATEIQNDQGLLEQLTSGVQTTGESFVKAFIKKAPKQKNYISQNTRQYDNSLVMEQMFRNTKTNNMINLPRALERIRKTIPDGAFASFDRTILKEHLVDELPKSKGFVGSNYSRDELEVMAKEIANGFPKIRRDNTFVDAKQLVERVRRKYLNG